MLDIPSWLTDLFRSLSTQSPLILTALAGWTIVIFRWRALRGAALPAFLGLSLFVVISIGFPCVWVLAPRIMQDSSAESMQQVFMMIGVANSFLYALALGLLVFAALAGRSEKPPAAR